MEKLKNSRVAVFGVGGVGGYVCEALVRSGVGAFDLIDDDKVCLTNLNRQIIATRKTIGQIQDGCDEGADFRYQSGCRCPHSSVFFPSGECR